jgi:hypothetical protein
VREGEDGEEGMAEKKMGGAWVGRRAWWSGAFSVAVVVAVCGWLVVGSASAACPNEGLRVEQPFGSALPDCRAYELVSPLGKDDNGVVAVDSRAAVSGEAIVYLSPGSFAGPRSALLESRYISRREASGWSTENISPPYTDYRTNALNPAFAELIFTPDLSRGVVRSLYTPLVEGEPVGYINLFLTATANSSYATVSSFVAAETEKEYAPFEEIPADEAPQTEGASTDLTHVVFQQVRSANGMPKHEHIYEWDGEAPALVDVPPPGIDFEGDDNVGGPASKNEPVFYGNAWHAVSADGSRVFFTAQEKQSEELVGQLFVRENPPAPQSPYVEGRCAVAEDACTIEVSASQKSNGGGPGGSDPHGPRPAFYRDASSAGSRVFFTSRAELTNDAYTGPEDNAANLYEYDVETGVLTDLTVDTMDVDGAAVLGVVNAAEDGSYIYFVANGALAEGAHPGNCKTSEGEASVAGERSCNLYVEHYNGMSWEVPRFIATLSGSNAQPFNIANRGVDGDEANWVGYDVTRGKTFGPGWHTARASADGRLLVFESELSLTGFDNVPVEGGACGEHDRCSEIYLYDTESGRLMCVSCDRAGRPTGSAALGGHEEVPASLSEPSPYFLPRNLSEGGGRLFFQSSDALVPQDSNGLLDVYEWEALGVGSCTAVSADFNGGAAGCVFPISNVAGGEESRFMDASASGGDTFIATADRLLPSSDTDTRVDVYDARVDGGFPAVTQPSVCESSDQCKPPVASQPSIYGTPASATLVGLGNLVPPPLSNVKVVRCRKRSIERRGKCVRKQQRKRHAGASRSHPRKGRTRRRGGK